MVSNPSPRVFLDTNVLFSGFYSPKGAPGRILQAWVTGRISIIVSRQVLDELVRTIKQKQPSAIPLLKELLMNAPPEIQADPSAHEVEEWTDQLQFADAAIIAAALNAGVDYFVFGAKHFTGNPDIARKSGLCIVSPTQFVKQWRSFPARKRIVSRTRPLCRP
jgi:predicted nucleic acid-binding protein